MALLLRVDVYKRQFVHAGTPAHVIRPHFKKILRFVPQGGNGFIFARKVVHPGTAPDPFLYEALQNNVSNITSIFSRYTGIALDAVSYTHLDVYKRQV